MGVAVGVRVGVGVGVKVGVGARAITGRYVRLFISAARTTTKLLNKNTASIIRTSRPGSLCFPEIILGAPKVQGLEGFPQIGGVESGKLRKRCITVRVTAESMEFWSVAVQV